jgi:hypothetical protein
VVTLCCVCNRQKVKENGVVKWLEKTTTETMVSHGYCPICAKEMKEKIHESQRNDDRVK